MRMPPPSTQNATVIPRIKEPIRPPETAGLIAHVYLDATVAASRFRPFARRRFKMARPAFVFIRSRKPCLRSRLIRLGWYVRFIAADPHSRLFVFQLSIHNPAARGHGLQKARRLLRRLSESPSVFSTYLSGKWTRFFSRPWTNRASPGKRESLPGSFRSCQCIVSGWIRSDPMFLTTTNPSRPCYSADRNGGFILHSIELCRITACSID